MHQTSLIVVDDFMPNALEIREKALAAGFKDHYYMEGTYQGTGISYNPPEIREALESFFNKKLDFTITAFRSGHKDTKLHVNIHADNSVSDWAYVYYLNLPEDCFGGTAFYTLKEYAWDKMPTQEMLEERGKTLEWMTDKWTKPDAWQLNTVAGMKFNRMIVYPTQYFHSRFPLDGWGDADKPEHARLVNVGFFK